jgi:hypothetical protein
MSTAAAAAPAPVPGKSLYKLILTVLLTLVGIDVIALFIAGAMHMTAVLNVALGIFVWVQMAMTGASALSIPVTLVRRALIRK